MTTPEPKSGMAAHLAADIRALTTIERPSASPGEEAAALWVASRCGNGFGPAAVKRATYEEFANRTYAAHAAIKLFFDHDPDLMSEQDVLFLKPTPAVVIYQ